MQKQPALQPQSGMTMIEVMVSFVLVAILLIGMNALWVGVARMLDDATLRQAAIFRLNGEMERLAEAYRLGVLDVAALTSTSDVYTDYYNATGYGTPPVDQVSGSYLDVTNQRIIYPRDSTIIFVKNDLGSTTTDSSFLYLPLASDPPSKVQAPYNLIYVYSATAGATPDDDDRNIVWLDRERNIVAQISWLLEDMPSTDPSVATDTPCKTTSCKRLTLLLDYPFRFDASATPPFQPTMGPIETITLQTIVGRRTSS